MHIILVNKQDALDLAHAINHTPNFHGLRVAIEGDSVKFKINQGMWSPPIGELDFWCEEAFERRMLEENAKHQSYIDAEHEL